MATVLVFDSGLGGLTVLEEIRALLPHAGFLYVADSAAFPYGRLSEAQLIDRVGEVLSGVIKSHYPDTIVIACNTASTVVLPSLRTQLNIPVVGTVPAIKPAAQASRSGMISVLATPGTIAHHYTHQLIQNHAAHCRVQLVGSTHLAQYAEAELRGHPVSDEALWQEISDCFQESDGKRTDAVVLACTHYPLLKARFEALAPWPVEWIDSGAAVARRVESVLSTVQVSAQKESAALLTGDAMISDELRAVFRRYGLGRIGQLTIPFFKKAD